MRATANEQREHWIEQVRKGLKDAASGKATLDVVYGQVGRLAAGQIKTKIASITSPALSPATIEARRARRKSSGVSTKPLVDTKIMIQSVESKVVNK